jgi:hypothetical protein
MLTLRSTNGLRQLLSGWHRTGDGRRRGRSGTNRKLLRIGSSGIQTPRRNIIRDGLRVQGIVVVASVRHDFTFLEWALRSEYRPLDWERQSVDTY